MQDEPGFYCEDSEEPGIVSIPERKKCEQGTEVGTGTAPLVNTKGVRVVGGREVGGTAGEMNTEARVGRGKTEVTNNVSYTLSFCFYHKTSLVPPLKGRKGVCALNSFHHL